MVIHIALQYHGAIYGTWENTKHNSLKYNVYIACDGDFCVICTCMFYICLNKRWDQPLYI